MRLTAISAAAIMAAGCGTPNTPDEVRESQPKFNSTDNDSLFYTEYTPTNKVNTLGKSVRLEAVSKSGAKSTVKLDNRQSVTVDTNYFNPENSKIKYQNDIIKF
jgi:hypothetical protein